MPKIKKLSPEQAQKIAAGQVVERPSNVVKELIENALDAGATEITIYIEKAGKSVIRVVDNGCGMSREDAKLCFGHHATSKITSVDDLQHITTFGFRGEALSAICAVSNVVLITKQKEDKQATLLELASTKIARETTTAANVGTDIAIKNLFFNVPVRKKFLKKDETEWRQIQTLFQAFCLQHMHVHFSLIADGKQQYNCPVVSQTIDRVVQLWDHSVARHMLHIDAKDEKQNLSASGVISNHQFYKYNRNTIFFFVNNRWIKNFKLANALIKGYQNVLPADKYPMACVTITIDPALIDVNIDPRKEEIKFLHPRTIEVLLKDAVKKQLQEHLSAQLQKQPTFNHMSEPFRPAMPMQFKPARIDTSPTPNPMPAASFEKQILQDQQQAVQKMQESTQPLLVQQEMLNESSYPIIGQYKKTYILLEKDDGLFIVDQHAAHERVLYELFSKRFEEVATINLLFPQVIDLSAQHMRALLPHLELFKKHGISLEEFGENKVVIHATPVHVKDISLDQLVRQVAEWIIRYQTVDLDQLYKQISNKLNAQMACKAAIKAGDTMSEKQMVRLLDDLNKTENRYICAHGRPTGWLLSLHEIEKKFKRKA